MSKFLKNYWYVASSSKELGDQPLGRIFLDKPIVLLGEKVEKLAPSTIVALIGLRRSLWAELMGISLSVAIMVGRMTTPANVSIFPALKILRRSL